MTIIDIQGAEDMARLRRLALDSQGLLQAQPFGKGLAGARKAVKHLGYVQIDTISVVERAHNHVFYSRVPNFNPDMTNKMLRASDIFEYWTHAAAFIPINDFRFSLPYKHAIKCGQTHWYKNRDKKLMKELKARIRSEGPIRSRDIEASKPTRAGWWDWKPAKKALEQLYMEGDLMVCDREGFQKTYDLSERVLPSYVDASMPSTEEFAAHIVDQQLSCHGFASLKGLTYLRRNTELRKAVKALVNDKVAQSSLEYIRVNNGEVFIIKAGALEHKSTRVSNRLSILSPFDNCVIQRDRLKAIFQYNYQIECYVPEAKRQYGYFCLPLLYRDEFIGRMDCKAHRKEGVLEIKSLHVEQESLDEGMFLTAFIDAVNRFCRFQKCTSISLTEVYPKRLTRSFRNALKACGA